MSEFRTQTSARLPISVVVGIPAALAVAAIAASWRGTPGTDFWIWFGACLAGELLWVRLALGGITMNMALACNFGALLLLPRGEAMVAAAASTLIAEMVFMRKPLVRCVFNGAQSALAVGAASLALGLIAQDAHLSAGPKPVILLAALGAAIIGCFFAVLALLRPSVPSPYEIHLTTDSMPFSGSGAVTTVASPTAFRS